MKKDFQKWHSKKSEISEIKKSPFFHEREIWFCYLGANVGFEQDGGEEFLRPVVVFRKFNNEIFWAIPLTKSKKKLNKKVVKMGSKMGSGAFVPYENGVRSLCSLFLRQIGDNRLFFWFLGGRII